MHRQAFRPLPPEVAVPMRLLPLTPLRLMLERLAGHVAQRHPVLFSRLGDHRHRSFLLDPTDLPVVAVLRPNGDERMITLSRRPCSLAWDARIAGPLAALLGMIHGAVDGDALFFSGDLLVEGDTEAVVSLRNALDDAELDLAAELSHTTGAFRPVLQALRPHLLPKAERLTGLSLTRSE